MTARSIGEVLSGAPPAKARRTYQPVRRGSRHRGERENRIWRPLGANNREARRFIGAMLRAAEQFEERNRQPGKRNGPLGDIAVRALRELFRIADWKTGCLEPAIGTICDRIRRSRAAVVKALARLKEHGFLDWIRRTEPTDNVGAGPQVRQITNAYGFDLQLLTRKAPSAAAWVKKSIGWGIPTPDCEAARREQTRADVEAMLNSLSCEELARAIIEDDELAEAVARVGRALDTSASQLGGQNPGDGE